MSITRAIEEGTAQGIKQAMEETLPKMIAKAIAERMPLATPKPNMEKALQSCKQLIVDYEASDGECYCDNVTCAYHLALEALGISPPHRTDVA